MAKRSETRKTVGLVLLVVGIGLAFWGYRLSGSLGALLTEAVTGAQTDKVMLLYIGGAGAFVAGLFLVLRK